MHVRCFQCDDDATQECPRCGALYCDEHGDALCVRCSDPALALPSYRVYRGSLLALLVGSIFAVWLLILPPASDALAGIISPTPTLTATATATPTEEASPTPTSTPDEAATETPSPTPTPTEPPASQEQTYIVQAGDTLFAIAERFVPADTDPADFANEIATANGIADASLLQIGQELIIPGG